jgi:hypothetical protein
MDPVAVVVNFHWMALALLHKRMRLLIVNDVFFPFVPGQTEGRNMLLTMTVSTLGMSLSSSASRRLKSPVTITETATPSATAGRCY